MEENSEQKWWEQKIKPLIGGTIVGLAVDASSDEYLNDSFFGIKVRTGKRGSKLEKQYVVWILADEEGNGAGAIDIMNFADCVVEEETGNGQA